MTELRGKETRKMIKTHISIDKAYCKGCEICVHACPKGVFAMSGERQSYGSLIPYAANSEKCTACGFCEIMCPDGCINVERQGGARG